MDRVETIVDVVGFLSSQRNKVSDLCKRPNYPQYDQNFHRKITLVLINGIPAYSADCGLRLISGKKFTTQKHSLNACPSTGDYG